MPPATPCRRPPLPFGGGRRRARGPCTVEPPAGQASVELVALLPAVVAVLALAWQVVVLGQAAWSAQSAARAAARAHAVGADAADAARATLPAALDRGLRVQQDAAGVVVHVRAPVVVPGLRGPELTARSSFADQS